MGPYLSGGNSPNRQGDTMLRTPSIIYLPGVGFSLSKRHKHLEPSTLPWVRRLYSPGAAALVSQQDFRGALSVPPAFHSPSWPAKAEVKTWIDWHSGSRGRVRGRRKWWYDGQRWTTSLQVDYYPCKCDEIKVDCPPLINIHTS
jgi:hypothetical protein